MEDKLYGNYAIIIEQIHELMVILYFRQVVPVYTLIDNINVDQDTGDLWIGAQPMVFDAIKHLENATHPCASQVSYYDNLGFPLFDRYY